MKDIYALIDPRDGRIRYIGASKNPSKRLKTHLRDKGQTRKARWIRSLLASDITPSLSILLQDSVDWQVDEIRLIAEFRAAGVDLTNLTSGGEGLHDPSPETRSKISANMSRRMSDPVFRAKMFTPERAAKISLALTGKPKSPEHVAKLPQNQKGYEVSDERAEYLRTLLRDHGYRHPKGQPMHPNARIALAISAIGNQHTLGRVLPEHEKRERSATLMGRSKSKEHREKISEGQRRSWAAGDRRGHANKRIQWPPWEIIEKELGLKTTGEVALMLGVKRSTLGAHIHRQKKKEAA